MDERKREEIRKESRKILDKFAKSLESVKFKEKGLKKQVGGFREEGSGKTDADFRERMFANAPSSDGDHIIAEKKKW